MRRRASYHLYDPFAHGRYFGPFENPPDIRRSPHDPPAGPHARVGGADQAPHGHCCFVNDIAAGLADMAYACGNHTDDVSGSRGLQAGARGPKRKTIRHA